MAQVNLTTFHEKIKKGWTQSDFEHELQMSPKQFLKFVRTTWPSNYKKILRDLDKNAKLANRANKNRSGNPAALLADADYKDFLEKVTAETLEKVFPETVQPSVTENNPTSEDCVHSSSAEDNSVISSPAPVFPNIDELQSMADALSLKICEQEVRRNELISNRRHSMEILRNKSTELERLKAHVDKLEEEVEEIIEESNQASATLNEVNIEIASLTENLSELRSTIVALKKVFIYVYPDGEIEIENCNIEVAPVANLDFTQFITDTRFEDLTLKEAKLLAELISLTNSLQEQNVVFDIVFESPALKDAWEKL